MNHPVLINFLKQSIHSVQLFLDSTLTLNGLGDRVMVMTTSSRSGAPLEGGWKVNRCSKYVVKRNTFSGSGRDNTQESDES